MNIQTPTERQMQPVVVAAASMQAPIAPRGKTAAFPTDLQGADVEALNRFNQALPEPQKAPQQAKKKKGEEEQVTEEAAASESEAVEVAQADTAGGVAEAASGSGGAAAGAGGADAVGAGTALNSFSPMLFIAPLLIGAALDDGSNPPPPPAPEPEAGPAPSPSPAPSRAPTPIPNIAPVVTLEHDEVKLVLNAGTGEIECAVVGGTDADGGPSALSFFFWNNGKPSTTSADGYFSIDAKGAISLTEEGEAAIGAGNPALPCAPSIELAVVAFDGLNYSAPKTLTVDRVLPTFLAAEGESPEGVDARYSVQTILTDGYAGNAEVHLGDHGKPHIAINDFDDGLDVIDFDGWDQVGVPLNELEMSRHEDKLHIEIEGSDGLETHISVTNQFAVPVDSEPSPTVEFVHFEQGTTYARYDLGGSQMQDDTWSCEGDYPYFQDHGVYLLSTEKASADGGTVNGTACNDVVVGSSEFKEIISGGAGKDLLFSQGTGDTLVGGAGDDLIVLDEEDHEHDHKRDHCEQTTVQIETAATNGLDTVVGFDEETTRIQLQSTDTSFALEGDDVEVFTEGALLEENIDNPAQFDLVFADEDDAATAVISMDAASPWNLHTWLNDLSSPVQEIAIDGASADLSLFFLVEESPQKDVDTFTHLYQAADTDADGLLSANEFTHMAQFSGVGVDAFSSSTFVVI